MQENKNKNLHKHFKMSNGVDGFFSSHKKIAVFIAVAITIILCVIILVLTDNKQPSDGNVLVNSKKNQINVDEYRENMKSILSSFRSSEITQESINSTIEDVLNLRVPVDYKEFHLETVIYLEREKDALQGKISRDEAIAKWSEIVEKNNWLAGL